MRDDAVVSCSLGLHILFKSSADGRLDWGRFPGQMYFLELQNLRASIVSSTDNLQHEWTEVWIVVNFVQNEIHALLTFGIEV